MDKEKLCEFLKNQSMPPTLQEICNNYGDLKEVEVRKFLSELEDENKIARYHGECGDTYFYVLGQGMAVEKQDNLETYLNLNKAQLRDMISIATKQAEIATKQAEIATKQAEQALEVTKSIYAEIIGIMSLFVAVFSLITINASIIPAVIGKATCEIIVICITVNISTIVSIIALVLAVRFWLIKPLQKSGAKK